MFRPHRLGALAFGAVMLALLALPGPATAARGKLHVVITTPDGVPANVVARGPRRKVVAKGVTGKRFGATLPAPAGRFRIAPQPVLSGGALYTGRATPRRVRVRAGRTANVRVRYKRARSARALRPVQLGRTSIALRWKGPRKARYVLRRATGADAPATRRAGKPVTVTGTRADDTGLEPGTTYSYSLFTRFKGRWSGPLRVSAGTAPAAGGTQATYITAPGALLAAPGDVASAKPTGTGVALRLAKGAVAPPIGTAVVLGKSAELAGGFLGTVTAVAPDGTATLTAGGLSDAFDYYALDLPALPGEPTALTPLGTPAAALRRAGDEREAKALPGCLGGSRSQSITFAPSLDLDGYFHARIDKYGIFGVDVPTGAHLDMQFTVTARGAVAARTSQALTCSLDFTPLMITLTTAPVPISFYLTPVAEVGVEGAVEVQNLGAEATAGVQFSGGFGITSGVDFSGSPILTASPLKPVLSLTADVTAKLGGEVVIGPGAGSAAAGVIAGVGGQINPFDARFGGYFPVGDDRYDACLRAEAAFTRELNLTAKAWLGGWDLSKSITIPALQGSTDYPGMPWYLPSGCQALTEPPVPQPGGAVLGPGIEPVSDSTTGGAGQIGRVDALIPGNATWVLSTGNVDDTAGVPEDEASSVVGSPGDGDLSAIAGDRTYDAAAYEVTLVPSGSTLHVKYAFASEEYPEFAGTKYDDAMEIVVDGENCARAPGGAPVSVNTINATVNADLFVDNTAGAPGYHTAMDGLTKMLQCDVPVTPGAPVHVKVAVADTSDGTFDSAVALADGGIWSD